MSADVPVLLIGFNRPDHLARVIECLRSSAPSRVFLAVDGPRPSHPQDADLVLRTRAMAQRLDWDCEVQTLFQETNLGCARGVSSAITWFFDNVEAGIILEDDVAPEPAFFAYCQLMLERYATDDQVCAITGTNFVPAQHQSDSTRARFSTVPVVWGWASWRRSWRRYSLDIAGWRRFLPRKRLLAAVMGNRWAYWNWSGTFDVMARQGVDTWDIQLVYAAFRDGALTVTPPVNLVENFGWGSEATHTASAPAYLQPAVNLLPEPPSDVEVDGEADAWLQRNVYSGSPGGLLRSAARHLRRSLRG